jgi:hypothetical protein
MDYSCPNVVEEASSCSISLIGTLHKKRGTEKHSGSCCARQSRGVETMVPNADAMIDIGVRLGPT